MYCSCKCYTNNINQSRSLVEFGDKQSKPDDNSPSDDISVESDQETDDDSCISDCAPTLNRLELRKRIQTVQAENHRCVVAFYAFCVVADR